MPQSFPPEARGQQREHDIPRDDGGKAAQLQENDHRDAREDENELNLVVFPRQVLELQGEKRNLGHQEETRDEHGEEQEKSIELLRHQEGVAAGDERSPKQRVGRCGHSDEGGSLPRVEVELGQPERGESRDEEGRVGHEVAQGFHEGRIVHEMEQMENHGRRRDPESNHVGQRVQFLPDG